VVSAYFRFFPLQPISAELKIKQNHIQRIFWCVLLFAAAVCRWLAGGDPSDTLKIHMAVASAIAEGEAWGMQALVGLIEYPPLPTFAVLLAHSIVPDALHPYLQPQLVLVTIAQVWIANYAARIVAVQRPSLSPRLAGAGAAFLILIGLQGTAVDSSYVLMLPAVAAAYHLCKWHREHHIRDFSVVALNGSLLLLCGPVGLVAALLLIFTMATSMKSQPEWKSGYRLLLFSPALYVAILFPLVNYLIMDRPLFWLTRGIGRLTVPPVEWPLLCCVTVGGAIAIFGKQPLLRLSGAWLSCSAAVMTYGAGIFAGQPSAMALPALLLGLAAFTDTKLKTLARSGSVLAIVACCYLLGKGDANAAFAHGYPSAAKLIELADRRWAQSRILVHDMRTAAIYRPLIGDRLVISLSYRQEWTRALIEAEQMHLLVPPDNGQFYGPNGALAQLHSEGHQEQWLLLERQWKNGWQLWRCLRSQPEPR